MGCARSQLPDAPDAVGPVLTLLTSPSKEKFTTEEEKNDFDRALVQKRLQIWVLRAELLKRMGSFGRMDPFVVVEHVKSDGHVWEFAHTRTDWGGHMKPNFNHLCRSIEVDSDDVIRFRLLEKSFGDLGTPIFCGEASATVKSLLRSNARATPEDTEPLKLKLTKNEEETGCLIVQAGLEDHSSQDFTRISAKRFETPVTQVPGRCSHFAVKLKDVQPEGISNQRWIAKDLAKAISEVPFYEEVRRLRCEGAGAFETLLDYILEYEGILEAHVEGQKPNEAPKQFLVVENLGVRDVPGSMFRRVDLKLGQGVPGASGASRLQALKQSLLEGTSGARAAAEGFRLERFQGSPASLDSADPLLELGLGAEGATSPTSPTAKQMVRQKVRKAMLQRMPAPDVIMYFADMQALGTKVGDAASIAQHLLSQMASKLAGLAVACRRAPAPQLWLGASLAVTLDTGAEGTVPPEVNVKLFGWGQACFTTREMHQNLHPSERRDRSAKWREFISSIDKVAWEASRAYLHRFGNSEGWKEVKFVVADFDAISHNDFIGQALLHLDEKNPLTGEQVIQLVDRSGNPVIGKNGLPTALTCSVHLHALTKVRLRALWRVQVHRCVNLPKRDLSGTSDAWVSVYATGGEESQFCFQQRSSVIPRNLNPEWNETFDLPLARPGNLLADWLDITAPSLGDAVTKTGEKLLPCATGSGFVAGPTSAQDEKVAFAAWSSALACAADRAARNLGTTAKDKAPVVACNLLVEPILTASDGASPATKTWSTWSWSAWNPFKWGQCG